VKSESSILEDLPHKSGSPTTTTSSSVSRKEGRESNEKRKGGSSRGTCAPTQVSKIRLIISLTESTPLCPFPSYQKEIITNLSVTVSKSNITQSHTPSISSVGEIHSVDSSWTTKIHGPPWIRFTTRVRTFTGISTCVTTAIVGPFGRIAAAIRTALVSRFVQCRIVGQI